MNVCSKNSLRGSAVNLRNSWLGLMAAFVLSVFFSGQVFADKNVASANAKSSVVVTLTVPKLDVDPYHKPYIAVWVETPSREGIITLAVWHEKDTWLKDIRQWWRKLGRAAEENLDGVSGATRKPGTYTVEWDGKDQQGNPLPAGEYLINVEASREEGGRSYARENIQLGQSSRQVVAADNELGEIIIEVNAQ